jgi:hypothetical protein
VGQALGQLVPIAVAAALSTVPITIMLLVLLAPNRNATALPYTAGWVAGTAAVVSLLTVATQLIPDTRRRQPQTAVGVLEVLIGVTAIVLGLLGARAHHPPTPGADRTSQWARRVGSLSSGSSLGIGLALNLRPKGLLLAAAAALVLRSASIDPEGTVLLIVVYTAIATVTVVAPVGATFVAPHRMEPLLIATRDWLTAHAEVLTTVIMLGIGVLLLGLGIGDVRHG